jgi:hypothetical protein
MKRIFLALSLLAWPALGQTPAPTPAPIAKPTPVASVKIPVGPLYAGDLITLDATASIGDTIDWEVVSPPELTTFDVDSNRLKLTFANRLPGTYIFRFEAESIMPDPGSPLGYKIAKSKQRVVFTTISSTPVPDPTPTPGPTPPPIPPTPPPAPVVFTGHVHATLVFDLDEPSTAPLRASTVKADLKALNADWYIAPTAGPVAKLFASYTTADGLPTVYYTDDLGKMLGTLKAPTTRDQVLAKMKAIRGVTN